MKSIIQKRKECYICGQVTNLHSHHILFGKNRNNSEKFGLKVWLCLNHHEGTNGVHGKNGHELDLKLKKIAQRTFEENHTREEFMKIFGRNYL